MNIYQWLSNATERLQEAGITTARLDCLVLLEDATGKNRAWLLAHPEFELPAALATILDARAYRRAQHVPLAYIRGHAEFYGREFAVNEHTLVPRPETEAMIELLHDVFAYKQPPPDGTLLADIGTGSGAIAITVKLEFPGSEVTAIDIDEKCLEAARRNAQKLQAGVTFLHGSLLKPLAGFGSRHTILLCNLPYVPDNFQINTAATHEPRHALFGGTDGLDLYREMFGQIDTLQAKPLYILTEALPPQHEVLAEIAHNAGYILRQTNDFIQLFSRS
ncbi:MAG TPA: HemK/PrmC family methyltransferase [Candidatus Saccharimonadales bacterium]|jgi:release factor glutamine methyltransferase